MKSRGNRKQKRSRKRPRQLRGGWGADLRDIWNKLVKVHEGETRGGIPDKRLTAAEYLYAAVQKLQNCNPEFQKKNFYDEDGEKTNADFDVFIIKRYALDIVHNCQHLLQNYNRMYNYDRMNDDKRNTFIDYGIENEYTSRYAIEGIASHFENLRACNEYSVPKSEGAEMLKPFSYEDPTPSLEIKKSFPAYDDEEGELDRRVKDELSKRAPADEPKAESSRFDPFGLTRRTQKPPRGRMNRWKPTLSASRINRWKPTPALSENVLAKASMALTQRPSSEPPLLPDKMARWKPNKE